MGGIPSHHFEAMVETSAMVGIDRALGGAAFRPLLSWGFSELAFQEGAPAKELPIGVLVRGMVFSCCHSNKGWVHLTALAHLRMKLGPISRFVQSGHLFTEDEAFPASFIQLGPLFFEGGVG